jgi:ATP-dependent RNA helicase DDX55/SPB4
MLTLLQAVTGSGKTLSFLIPIVERLLKADDPNKKGFVRSIVVAPTKELAIQIYQVLKDLLAFHQPSAAYLAYKKVHSKDTMMFDIDEEEEKAARPPPGPYIIPQLLCGGRTKLPEDLATFSDINPNVLIATPRRLVEVLNSSRVIIKRHWFDLLVMDEADRLLDANFKADLSHILDSLPKERRTGLFSASVSAAVDELVRVGMRYPFKISAKVRSKNGTLDKKTPESLKLCYAIVKPTHKLPMLKKVLEQAKAQKTIVYVSTRAGVDYWDRILPSLLGVKVYPMHGDHKSEIRTKNLNRFTDATEPAILLTTDVLARGIDISDVDMVAQLDLPSQPKDFIHRCGRSGRAGKRGLAITFITQGNEEDYIRYLEVQGTKLEPYPNTPTITDSEAAQMTADIRALTMQKRELHDRAAKAFVSSVQAYNKTIPSDIFNISKIDWPETGKAWGLLRWPKMPELRRHYPDAVPDRTLNLDMPADFDLINLAYADAAREEKRQADIEARARGEDSLASIKNKSKKGGKLMEQKRRLENAWSGQKAAKVLREDRREHKEVRRTAEKRSKMSEEELAKEMELQAMIAQVRERNRLKEEAGEEAEFEGFDD